MKTWKWTAAKDKAALLLAQGELPRHAIGELVGVDRHTVHEWEHNPEFVDRVHTHVAALTAGLQEEIRAEASAARRRRKELIETVATMVDSLTDEDRAAANKNPIALLSLFERLLRNAESRIEKTQQQTQIQNDAWPLYPDTDPAVQLRLVEIIQRETAARLLTASLPTTELSGIPEADD